MAYNVILNAIICGGKLMIIHSSGACRVMALYLLLFLSAVVMSGCAVPLKGDPATTQITSEEDYQYFIGPGDRLDIFVWRNPELSVTNIPVRPDGRISSPLVEDILASGKTPIGLARDIESKLREYIKDPLVTVTITDFTGRLEQQIRVIGEAAQPMSIPYSRNMTLLDAMIAVGGLTEFAAGNRAVIVRNINGGQDQIRVRLEDLIKDGDISANIGLAPGDILVIPESMF